VHVDCNDNSFSADLPVNKKVTTKCVSQLSLQNWGGEEAGDEWFNWNLDQDKKLDERFGAGTYADATLTPSPTPKPTIKPTAKPTITPSPTPAPTRVIKPTPTPTKTPTPTPTFILF